MSSASSIMSELSSAATLASQWTQGPAVAEPSDGQPFGAFLDADDTPPLTAAQSAGTALQFGPNIGSGATGAQEDKTAAADTTAARAKALDGARWAKWRAAHTTADGASGDESQTGATTATPSSSSPAESSSNADAPANTETAAATQPGTASADADAAAAGSAAAAANALALVATDSAVSTLNGKIGAGKADDGDNSAGQSSVPGGSSQALAAAFVLNTGAGAAVALGARTAGDAHGQSVTKSGVSSGGAQNGTADAKSAAPTKSTTAATASDDQAGASDDPGSGPSGTAADASAPTTAQPQAQVQSADNAALTALSGTIAASGSGGRTTQATGALAAANAAGSAGLATSAAASAMANFGLAAGNAASTAASTAAADGGVAVPLAGIAVAIAARAQGGTNRFNIQLDPPELGRIEVRLGVDGKGQVTTHVTADRADTLQLLQSQQSQLQRSLEQAGLKTADNGLQFTLRDQSFAGQNNAGSGGGQQSSAQLVIPDSDAAPVDTAQIYSRLRLGGGLDIKV